MAASLQIGSLAVGERPLVVGSLVRRETLDKGLPPGVPCDVVEIRYDLLADGAGSSQEIAAAALALPRPILFTCRSPEEGGGWRGTENERKALLVEALEWADALDVEMGSGMARQLSDRAWLAEKPVIVSFHDFEATPSLPFLKARLQEMLDLGPGIIPKIVTMVRKAADCDVLADLLDSAGTRAVCIMGMGEAGIPTRFELPARGGALVYGFLDEAAAPGQVSCRKLREAFPLPA